MLLFFFLNELINSPYIICCRMKNTDFKHNRKKSNVFEDAKFWFLPKPNQILPNFTPFIQVLPKFA